MVDLKSKQSIFLSSFLHANNIINKHSEPVFLNVYDLLSEYRTIHCLFTYCTCYRLGIYHTSIQVYDTEYYYGNGICKCRPHSHVGRLVLSKQVGTTDIRKDEIETKILFDMYDEFSRKNYDLLQHNCNHFTNSLLNRLVGVDLPVKFNRTERCIVDSPCCSRTLKCIFGNDWTRPTIEERKICCHRKLKE
ncbi:unnamed protein product [Adineta steineri]|uniref:PPPDE domain-containing protein n=1 Tax=Adineta steineri TaxID=433720 RepID=A0A819JAR4_9BILA|nr:unnamed protein product [Adineta steineri]